MTAVRRASSHWIAPSGWTRGIAVSYLARAMYLEELGRADEAAASRRRAAELGEPGTLEGA